MTLEQFIEPIHNITRIRIVKLMELVGMLTVREMERCKKNCEKDKK